MPNKIERVTFIGTAGVTEVGWKIANRNWIISQIVGVPDCFVLCVRTSSGKYRELKPGSQLKNGAIMTFMQKQPDYQVTVMFRA